MLQWHIPGESPFELTKISSLSDITGGGGGMTVPVQRNSMAVLQPPRSRFMINDILAGSQSHHHHSQHPGSHQQNGNSGGGGGGGGADSINGSSSEGRTPSPGPRDLSIVPGGHHLGHHPGAGGLTPGAQHHLGLHHHHHHHLHHGGHMVDDDVKSESDSDDSGPLDSSSVCSNGESPIWGLLFTFEVSKMCG